MPNSELPKDPMHWTDPKTLLSQIGRDLFGLQGSSVPQTPAEETGVPQAVQPPKPAELTFEEMWRLSDEYVNWTEALVNPVCPDGLTEPALWLLYHQEARAVLDGDVSAYLTVLDAAKPLDNLKPYAENFEVAVENADHILCAFDGKSAHMNRSLPDLRHYLAGMALRVGRDLMGLLPVDSVTVIGRYEGENLLVVTLQREQLRRVRFAVAEPEALIRSMGGVFGAMDDDEPRAET